MIRTKTFWYLEGSWVSTLSLKQKFTNTSDAASLPTPDAFAINVQFPTLLVAHYAFMALAPSVLITSVGKLKEVTTFALAGSAIAFRKKYSIYMESLAPGSVNRPSLTD